MYLFVLFLHFCFHIRIPNQHAREILWKVWHPTDVTLYKSRPHRSAKQLRSPNYRVSKGHSRRKRRRFRKPEEIKTRKVTSTTSFYYYFVSFGSRRQPSSYWNGTLARAEASSFRFSLLTATYLSWTHPNQDTNVAWNWNDTLKGAKASSSLYSFRTALKNKTHLVPETTSEAVINHVPTHLKH